MRARDRKENSFSLWCRMDDWRCSGNSYKRTSEARVRRSRRISAEYQELYRVSGKRRIILRSSRALIVLRRQVCASFPRIFKRFSWTKPSTTYFRLQRSANFPSTIPGLFKIFLWISALMASRDTNPLTALGYWLLERIFPSSTLDSCLNFNILPLHISRCDCYAIAVYVVAKCV